MYNLQTSVVVVSRCEESQIPAARVAHELAFFSVSICSWPQSLVMRKYLRFGFWKEGKEKKTPGKS